MDGFSSLRLFADESSGSSDHTPLPKAAGGSDLTLPRPDPHVAATRELIRPPTVRRGRREYEPFSAAWFEELEQKRYQRHGAWLPHALEFGRHPGESLLLLGCGLGTDAVRYARTGTNVTVATESDEHPHIVRDNFARHALSAEFAALDTPFLPFNDGQFDVVTWNALYDAGKPNPVRVAELHRVLKPGGKLIGLFPARFDAAFWQDILIPLQRLWWRRPPDPATAPKTTARELRRVFGQFAEHRILKRHLRRGELPHAWRVLPLMLLERWIGRVLVLKAKKPIQFARLQLTPEDDRLAA
ncbi:MAG: class I SAM-dependent methyltransferase [Planctomycetes bacterium]|nr:class I SAM-dependent methyltransferase [Planctomycetota bacterium]